MKSIKKLYLLTVFLLDAIEKEDVEEISKLVADREVIFNEVMEYLSEEKTEEEKHYIEKFLEKNNKIIECLNKLKKNRQDMNSKQIKKAFQTYNSYSKIS